MTKWLSLFGLALIVWTQAAHAADRVALVIGMSNYDNIQPLKNTQRDAEGVSTTLTDIGFEVVTAIDASQTELLEIMGEFQFRAETADLALIYFAGHGVEVDGVNYLVPVDAAPRQDGDIQKQSVSLRQFLKTVDSARQMRVVILDSCRDNPFTDVAGLSSAPSLSVGSSEGGLAPASPDRGTLVAFAARDGQVAFDGLGDNSPFAEALMTNMRTPGLEIGLMFRQVRDEVLKATKNLQEPHTYGSLSGAPYYLAGPASGDDPLVADDDRTVAWSQLKPDQELQLAALAERGDTRSMLGLAYMRLNPEARSFDPDQAVDLLQRAADAGSPEAQYELAKLYEKGIGVESDPVKSLELFQAAADQGFADAINDLGFMHYQGLLGLREDRQQALRLFEQAANLRHPQAQFNFAALIDDGLIDGQGAQESARYLYAALRSGSTDVLEILTTRPTMFKDTTRRALQSLLQDKGFYAGAIDGDFGPGTQRSLSAAYSGKTDG
ncbi:caspase family protein [Actibacterium sp. 188UL27-1]|uniref:caspase family protein n=1 Tax=Actibacterium sp. 188UL27-1 TaxID=2786961 RepID=UPI0019588ADD|nr:caspase family protein [Actibacterium sp. 188UL27-1]MBM7069425.1 caspase family protein [Actibacterium sp. 188UL27-1]